MKTSRKANRMKTTRLLAGSLSRLGLALVVCACIVSACDISSPPIPPTPTAVPVPTTTPPPPPPTPAVDLARARQTFDAGGELTYAEVVALRLAIVGDPAEARTITDLDQYYDTQGDMQAKEVEFAGQLARCRLKESLAWVADWQPETDAKYQLVANATDVSVYMYDPYSGPGKEANGPAELVLHGLTDQQVAPLKYGQRLRFTGALALVGEQVAVTNANYAVLDADPSVPPPSAAELKDVRISLSRSVCFGTCPNYTLTITADGRVTFDGQHYTRVTGAASTTIDQAQIIELITEIKKADFFTLADKYAAPVTDAPSYTLTLSMAGRSKTVDDYVAGPHRLTLLMNRIDQIVNSAQWIK